MFAENLVIGAFNSSMTLLATTSQPVTLVCRVLMRCVRTEVFAAASPEPWLGANTSRSCFSPRYILSTVTSTNAERPKKKELHGGGTSVWAALSPI